MTAAQVKRSDSDPEFAPRDYQAVKTFDVEAGRHSAPGSKLQHAHKGSSHSSWTASLPTSLKERSTITASTAAVVSGILYSLSSAVLTLLNKKVLVHYDFTAVYSLLCFHCTLAVFLVRCCSVLGWANVEPLSWDIVRIWMPVNLIFVAMLATNFIALQRVGVGMVSVLKNLSNFFIICGDYVFFARTYSWHVWLCLTLMAASVVAGGITDIRFSWDGYGWQMANNVFTAGYALYLSRVTERVSGATHDHKPLNQMSMVYYNNMLSIPLTLLLVLLHGEFMGFWQQPALYQPSFQALAVMGGVFGFVISFSSIWFVSLTTATFYSLVGSFNKVVTAAVGILWFHEQSGVWNLASIAAGLLAGTLLPFIKMRASHHQGPTRAAADKLRAATAAAVCSPTVAKTRDSSVGGGT